MGHICRWAGVAIIAAMSLPRMGAAETIVVQRVASNIESPTYITTPPHTSSRLYVLEQYTGKIWVISNGVKLPTPFLDLSARSMLEGTEQGMCGLVFHPQYEENGYFFVNFTNNDGDTVIERYRVSANPYVADLSSVKPIMTIEQPRAEHNAGMMAFGPNDGLLYISVGDGGLDSFTITNSTNSQELTNPLGKILRIDVDTEEPYAVPTTNPFVGEPGADERIWMYGLRNPWRYSFDSLTGDMFIGDVGFLSREEVNVVKADVAGGQNFGWPLAEGLGCMGGFPGDCHIEDGRTPPVHDYRHIIDTKGFAPAARAIVGGYVYRGSAIPEFQGLYFFADYAAGQIWSFRYEDGEVTEFTERTEQFDPLGDAEITQISSFGEDAQGELYFCSYEGGEVYKIVPLSRLVDLNRDGFSNAVDVQIVLNAALGLPIGAAKADVFEDGEVDATDIQYVINGVLGK